MSLISNAATFKNWHALYLARYGFLKSPFILVTRKGERIRVRPGKKDAGITKSIMAKQPYYNDFVRVNQGDIVVDVGANIGAFTILAARKASKVIAYEPEPENFSCLCANIELNGLKNAVPVQAAAAGSTGKRGLCIEDSGHSASNSFYLRSFEKSIEVQTFSIEDIINTQNLKKIDFLKLDCEGAEADIVKSLPPKTAAMVKSISMEFHHGLGMASQDMISMLRGLGYSVKSPKGHKYIFARRDQ